MQRLHDPPGCRILYVERTTWLGGSSVSLNGLLKGLDTGIYRPVILIKPSNGFRQEWERLGEVILEERTPPNQPLGNRPNVSAKLCKLSPKAGSVYLQMRDLLIFLRRDRVAARRLAPLLADRGIDLIHHNNGLPFDRVTVTAGWLAGIDQLCHFRAFAPLSPVDRWLARKVRVNICVSQAVKQYLVRQGLPENSMHVVYNPIDLEAFTAPADVAGIRSDLKLGSSDLVLTNVARLDWWKGQDGFVEAIRELKNRRPEVRALIVGDPGPTSRSLEFSRQLRRSVDRLGLNETVLFTGLRRDIPSIMAASDILVHTAAEPEPLGRVVMEGMAAGRPVIATAAGGVKEIIQDRVTGILVPPANPQAIVDAVELLMQDPVLQAKICRNAREYAQQNFSVQRHWDSVGALYRQVRERPHQGESAPQSHPLQQRAEKGGWPR